MKFETELWTATSWVVRNR